MKKFLLFIALSASCLFQANAGVVLSENFDLFTAGSDTAPDPNYMEDVTGYTQTPGWIAQNICQAGGSVYVPVSSSLYTPTIDVSANGGNYVVTFKAKSDSNPGMILVSDQYMSSYDFRELTSEWQEFSMTLTNGSPATQVVFMAMYSDFYLDDVVISDGGVDIPVAISSTDFTRDSFTANWMPASGATSYLLDVFTYVYNHETTVFEPEYLFKDKEVTGTSYVVTEGEYDIPYYYEVAAKDGNSISKKSNRVTVTPTPDEVEAPVANEASNIAGGSFLASWNESNIATKYYLHVTKAHTATSAETFTLFNSNFSEFTEGSIESPRKQAEYLFDGDWSASVVAFANGCIGINNEDISFFGQSVLISPLIQTSAGNNKITVSFDAIATMGMENALVQLIVYDNVGNVEDVLEGDITLSEAEWQKYDITFDNPDGVAFNIVITSEESGRMFIDNLNASINLSASEEIIVPVRTYDVTELSYTANNLGIDNGDKVCYYVTASWAVRQQEGVVRQIPEVKSSASNVVWVNGLEAGIEDVISNAKSEVRVSDKTIEIINPNNASISILSIDGKVVYTECNAEMQKSVNVNSNGVYIVVVGNEIHKVVVK